MRWMVLGSSPSAPEHHNTPDVDVSISSGDGILLRSPTYYLIVEESAIWRHPKERQRAQNDGTKVLLTDNLVNSVRGAKFQKFLDRTSKYMFPYDELVRCNVPIRKNSWKSWRRGSYIRSCSGVVALQYAINHGATDIHMVGMEGYTALEGPQYFNGQPANNKSHRFAQMCHFPLTQRIIAQCPDVSFTTYGRLTYDLFGDNVTHLRDEDKVPV